MSAILKKIQLREDLIIEDTRHPIIMYFSKDDSDDIYPFFTSLETQYCSEEEQREGLLEACVKDMLDYAKTQIGLSFDINLYKFKVSELTDGLFVALEDYSDSFDKIYYFKQASFLSKDDLYISLKYKICLRGLQGIYTGITSQGKEKRIDETLVIDENRYNFISAEQNLRYKFLGEHPWEKTMKEKIKELNKKLSMKYKGKERIETLTY